MTDERTIECVVRRFPLGTEPSDRQFWLSRSPAERVAAVEAIRREYHGWKPGEEPRLVRVIRVVKR